MAKRLSETILGKPTEDGRVGYEVCRNCGGGIIVDAADHRSGNVPHRRVCRKCGVEYGTTRSTLYPPPSEYGMAPSRFYSRKK